MYWGEDIHYNNDQALLKSVEYNYLQIIEIFLKYGANIHMNDDYLIYKIIKDNKYEIIKIIKEMIYIIYV